MNDVRTPYDEELAKLNRCAHRHGHSVGDADRRSSIRKRRKPTSPPQPETQAARAGFLGWPPHTRTRRSRQRRRSTRRCGQQQSPAGERVAPKCAAEPMQTMNAEEKSRYIEGKQAQSPRRSAKTKSTPSLPSVTPTSRAAPPAKSGFDGRVRETMKKQAADVGLMY